MRRSPAETPTTAGDGPGRLAAWRARLATSPRYPNLVLLAALSGAFSVGVTVTILAVSLPSIATELGSSTSTLTWVITGPSLATIVVAPAAGKAGDLWGHRRVMLIGLTGAAASAGLTALAWDSGSLIATRVLTAALGAAAGPASMAMANHVFPPARRVQAMGYWSTSQVLAPAVGLVVGGPLVDAFGWRVIFVVQAPLVAVCTAACALVLPETPRKERVTFDWRGVVTLGLAASALLLAVNRGPVLGWTSPLVLAGLVVAPVMLAWFVHIERRVASPLLPLRYFARSDFAFPIVAQSLVTFAYFGAFILTPLLLGGVLGYDATRTGLIATARPATAAVTGVLAGRLARRMGMRLMAVGGSLLVMVSMFGFAAVGEGTSWVVPTVALVVSGFGFGCLAPAVSTSVANAVDEGDLGIAGAAQQTMQQMGGLIGMQVMQAVQVARASAVGEVDAFGDAFLVGAGVTFAGAMAAARIGARRRSPAPVEAVAGAAP